MGNGQRGNPTPATTQMSAALTIWEWIQKHGRPPKASECRKANGLNGYDLYYRVFGASNFSNGVIPLVSALCGSGVKMRQCLGNGKHGDGCTNEFPNVGAHVRLCQTCRNQREEIPEHQIPAQVRRLTMRELGAGTGGWQALDAWAQEIDWDGKKYQTE